jgi:uncharacterized Zn finger protein
VVKKQFMKSIAQIDPPSAEKLAEWIKSQQIPCEVKVSTVEGGLEAADIMVSDEDFDRACDAAEQWDADRRAEEEKYSIRRCDQCGAKNFETIPHDKLEFVLRCKDCGNLMPL